MPLDREGVLLVEFLPQGDTINSEKYCSILTWLYIANQNKSNWGQFDHHSYSSDLVPSDCNLMIHLKKHLAG